MKKYITEIETALAKFPQRTSSQNPESYIGGGQSKLRYIGLSVPHLRQALHSGFSFSQGKDQEKIKIWNYIWMNSDCYEVMSIALAWFYDKKQKALLVKTWPTLKKWALRIDNWAHSDTLSGIYAQILEQDPLRIYPTLVQWNSSKNPWLRRLSIVSLVYYSSQRERILPVSKILNLVKPQLHFDHYYVQKGVGWTLRETYNIYPEKTLAFLRDNIKSLSPQAFSAATEKLNAKEKSELKSLRKG